MLPRALGPLLNVSCRSLGSTRISIPIKSRTSIVILNDYPCLPKRLLHTVFGERWKASFRHTTPKRTWSLSKLSICACMIGSRPIELLLSDAVVFGPSSSYSWLMWKPLHLSLSKRKAIDVGTCDFLSLDVKWRWPEGLCLSLVKLSFIKTITTRGSSVFIVLLFIPLCIRQFPLFLLF